MNMENLYTNRTHVVREASVEEIETMLAVLAWGCGRMGRTGAAITILRAREILKEPAA